MYEGNRFKNDVGAYLLGGMFYEQTLSDKRQVLYTLKDRDHVGYPSLYRLYMEADDPTEYNFAIAHLDGWHHWERLLDCTWFEPFIARWRRELEVRFRARSLLNIREVANNPDAKEQYQANKFLVGQGWKEGGPKRRAGQPSKAEIKTEANRLAQISQNLDDDFERISGRAN